MFAINIGVKSKLFFHLYMSITATLISCSNCQATPPWRGSFLGMDLNALVAENRTWLQFLMEQASDLHLSYLLEASVSQVSFLVLFYLFFVSDVGDGANLNDSLLMSTSKVRPYSFYHAIDIIFVVTKIMRSFENSINMNQQQINTSWKLVF
jgi:hypothetical protein